MHPLSYGDDMTERWRQTTAWTRTNTQQFYTSLPAAVYYAALTNEVVLHPVRPSVRPSRASDFLEIGKP